MAKRPSAVGELERLEAQLAECREARQQVHAEAERLHAERDRLKAERIDAFACGDEVEGDRLGETIAAVIVKAETAAAKLAGADERARRAEAAVLELHERRGTELLEAEVERGQQTAEALAEAVRRTLALDRELIDARRRQDEVLAKIPGRSPRMDGAPPTHPWESQLADLRAVVRQHPEAPAITPRCLEPQPLVTFPDASRV